jgi:tRNA G18 (ribose-2'-O)-methylase SpoU
MYPIHSIDDPRVAIYRNMKERTLRGENIFVTEGLMLTERLLKSRFAAESLLVSQRWAWQVEPLVPPEVPIYVAPEDLVHELVGFPFHRGVLGAGRRSEPLTLDTMLAAADARTELSLIVCPQVNQAENLGLVFRTAAAFGIDGLLLGEQCCDPFSRRCLRLSMGGVLRVPFVHSHDLLADLDRLKTRWGFERVATVLDPAAEPLAGAAWKPRTALLFGNEFEGLSTDWLAACDRRVTIPMQPGTDSLNLGVAAGIFVYEMKKGMGGRDRGSGGQELGYNVSVRHDATPPLAGR